MNQAQVDQAAMGQLSSREDASLNQAALAEWRLCAEKMLTWEQSLLAETRLKGLGPKSKQLLIDSGIKTLGELLAFLPREYQDFEAVTPIHQAPLDKALQIRGRVLDFKAGRTKNQLKPFVELLIDDGFGTLRAIWFNQPYLKEKFAKGQILALFGKVRFDWLGRVMNNPKFEILEQDEAVKGSITPIYRQVGGLRSEQINLWVIHLLEMMPKDEILPPEVVARHQFPIRSEALRTLHRPATAELVAAIQTRSAPALRRMIFEEFYRFQEQLQQLVSLTQTRDHCSFSVEETWLKTFAAALPFSLTDDQMRANANFVQRLREGERIYALVQGDVGCGKTLIGFYMAYIFTRARLQTAMLCPTSVLAHQHGISAARFLEPLGVRVAVFTAQNSARENRELLERLEKGEIDLAIGTHRLIQKDVQFARLGLALIDEQHRFGVNQRRALLKKGKACHYIAFSATPIPRSLALTLHGEHQLIQIKEKPPGRAPIKTILKKDSNRAEIVAFAKTRIAAGESIYWVFPLIEGEEESAERSAAAMFAQFRQQEFAGIGIGLVHGRLGKDEIEVEMKKFRAGETRVLVATTVIEVGVDVPSASVMVVEGATRFGLSQLHQLRGRVGRGSKPSACVLMVEKEYQQTALQRLRFLEKHDDGFKIAEFDLELRGAGHLLGHRQSGELEFRYGDPWLDRELMEAAKTAINRNE